MAYRIRIMPQAEADLRAIRERLDTQAPAYVDRWIEALEKQTLSLEEWPLRCALAPENDAFAEEIRQLIYGRRHGRYRILFHAHGEIVDILHIRHAAREQWSGAKEDDLPSTDEEAADDRGPEAKGDQGTKKGDMFDKTLAEVRSKFADIPPQELQAIIEEAVTEVRKEMREERQEFERFCDRLAARAAGRGLTEEN